jgi:tetratricopeptide (TPR) repeat protein
MSPFSCDPNPAGAPSSGGRPAPSGTGMVRGGRPSLWARFALLAGTLAFAAACLEIGFRIYYRLSGDATADLRRADEDMWRDRWIASHRGRDIDALGGSDEYHPRYGWRPRANLTKARFDSQAPVSTNSRGWRNLRDFAFEKPPSVKRLVLVGDSFTYGEQEEDEHIWPAVLQEALPACQVINLGVHGYGTDQQLLVLQDEGVRYHPDIVVVGFFVHNVYRNVLRFRDYAKPRFVLVDGALELTNVPVPAPRQVLAAGVSGGPTSYAWHWIAERLRGRLQDPDRDILAGERGPLTRALLAEMYATSTRAGARMLVVIIPNPPKPVPQVERAVVEWGRQIGYDTLSLRKVLKDVEEREHRPTYYLHFSRLGHVVVARAVLERLLALGWIQTGEVGDPDRLEQRYQLALNAEPLDPESERIFAGYLTQQGKLDEAIAHYQSALARGSHRKVEIHTNLGSILRLRGDLAGAAAHYRAVIELDPAGPAGYMNLGDVLMARGRYAEAAEVYRRALRLSPAPPAARRQLDAALARHKETEQAMARCREGITTRPAWAGNYAELSVLFLGQRQYRRATEVLRQGLVHAPNDADLLNNLAWVLATCPDEAIRDGHEAVRLMQRLGDIQGISAVGLLDTAAAAYAEIGEFDQAVQAAQRAIDLAPASTRPADVQGIQARLKLYRAHRAYHEAP